MRLILLRHVESISNRDNSADSRIDSELSERGLENSKKLVQKLREFKFDLIVVSPLKRTLGTLKSFLDSLKIKPRIIVSELTLERNLGKFTGSKMGTFQRYCEENNFDKVFQRPQEGESIEDVYKRAKKFLDYLNKNFRDKTILICGHKNFLLCLETAIKDEPIKDFYLYSPFKTGELREYKL